MTDLQLNYISEFLKVSKKSVAKTIQLLEEGATVPFIARYRKEVTGSLDEVSIFEIKKLFEKLKEADKRREAIIESIESQGKLSDELRRELANALFVKELEELYLPYKPKRKTRATMAIEKGLEPLAQVIYEQKERDLLKIAEKYINDLVLSVEDALSGARDIIAEWISDTADYRAPIRNLYEKSGILIAEIRKGKEEEGQKYKDYFEYEEKASKIPSHRYLAIKRGESEKILKVAIQIDNDAAVNVLRRKILGGMPAPKEQVVLAIEDSLKRLILPSLEKEYDNVLKEKADQAAITIFDTNLRQLLLAAPLGQKRVIAIDPGFRTGCKLAILDEQGNLIKDDVIYLHSQEAEAKLVFYLDKYKTEAVAIGNGTASRETEQLVRSIVKKRAELKEVKVIVVSEQGASIYSASEVARDEFPDKDITVRGAVSIGRRLMDPLSELVKIDPKSIGVGQYQHDVNQKELKESLDTVVVSCVNQVGVELNTASKHLLSYVSGIGPGLAQNILDYRAENGKFKSRVELKKVPRLGEKAYEQAAGFLRVRGAKNPLDNSGVHPESYAVVQQMAKDLNVKMDELIGSKELARQIDLRKYQTATVGLPTLKDILEEIQKPGRDPREQFETFEFADVSSIADLRKEMILPGIVTNITAFGCFVDIGVGQDGLVHLSQLANRFIKDPNEVVKVHQKVSVKVLEVDEARKRISLSMKEV